MSLKTEKCRLTPEGGIAIQLTNKTGAASVKGSVVRADTSTDNAFILLDAGGQEPIGVVYESGIADGSECWVIIAGRVQILLQDSTASTRGNWVEASATTAGRADATNAAPVPATHWKEIGHCMETKTGGTNVLAYCIIHFN